MPSRPPRRSPSERASITISAHVGVPRRVGRSLHHKTLTTALDKLSPVRPILRYRELEPQAAKRLTNLMHTLEPAEARAMGVVKIAGLGKGPHVHSYSRPDLDAYATADLTLSSSEMLTRWYATHFAVTRFHGVPPSLVTSMAMRATWSIGRVALALDAVRAGLSRNAARSTQLAKVLMTLRQIAYPWVRALPPDLGPHAFTSGEYAFSKLTTTSCHRPEQLLACTGSALVSDIRYEHVVEARFRPAVTASDCGARVADWSRSSEVTDRVLGGILGRAGVKLADPSRLFHEACRACDTDVWAAAALALFPSSETLELALAPSKNSRTQAARLWSAAQIETALRGAHPQPAFRAASQCEIVLRFDGGTVERAVSLFTRVVQENHRRTTRGAA